MITVTIEWDNDKPLSRCKGESKRANDALTDYFNMGSGRNLRGLVEQYTKQLVANPQTQPPSDKWSTISGWSAIYAWQLRVARADELQREDDRKRLQEERLEREREWQRRREQVREEDWALSLELRSLAKQVLEEGPNFLKTKRKIVRGKDGGPDQILTTVALDIHAAVRASETASRLARLAADMATEHIENDNITGENLEEVREKRWKQIQSIIADMEDKSGEGGGANA